MDTTALTKGVISREEAERISPEYARFAADGDWRPGMYFRPAGSETQSQVGGEYAAVTKACRGLRHWQRVVTHIDGQFVMARVASVRRRARAVDGLALSVSNGEAVWRVDGGRWAFPAD